MCNAPCCNGCSGCNPPSGGFGRNGMVAPTRSSGSPPMPPTICWRAKEAGDAVPEAMLNQALNRLQAILPTVGMVSAGAGAPSTAGWPIRLTVPMCWPGGQGAARYPAPCLGQQADHARSGLPLLHLSWPLGHGDEQNAAKALSRALATERRDDYLGDYGSPLRDQALEALPAAPAGWLRSAGRPSVPKGGRYAGSPSVAQHSGAARPVATRPRRSGCRLAGQGGFLSWQWIPERFGSAAAGHPEALAASAVTNEGKGSSMCSAPGQLPRTGSYQIESGDKRDPQLVQERRSAV